MVKVFRCIAVGSGYSFHRLPEIRSIIRWFIIFSNLWSTRVLRSTYYSSHAFKTAKFLLVSNFFVSSIEAIPLKTCGDHPAHCIVHTTNKTIEQSSNCKRESTKRESLEENSRRVRTVAGALSFRQVTGESLIAR